MAENEVDDSEKVLLKEVDIDQLLIDTINIEIKKQRIDSSNILSYATTAGFFVLLVLFIMMAPEIAKRFTPELEIQVLEKQSIINKEIEQFQTTFLTRYKKLTDTEFKNLLDNEKKKEIFIERRRITNLSNGPTIKLMITKFIEKLNVEKDKISNAFTLLPIIFVAMFAGSLFTYRFHMNIIKELYDKRTKILLSFYEIKYKEKNSNHIVTKNELSFSDSIIKDKVDSCKCIAITKKGTRCKKNAYDKNYCSIHLFMWNKNL